MFSRILCVLFSGSILLLSAAAHSQVVINEYSCANLQQTPDNFNEYEDYIELYNPSASAVNIGGFFLSDKITQPLKWSFPAGTMISASGFIRVWASGRNQNSGNHYHSNFRLSQTKSNPEFIVLSDNTGTLIDSLTSPRTPPHQSRGRYPDGSATWKIFTAPTPNTSNNAAAVFTRYAAMPVVSSGAGFYGGSISVSLSTTEPGGSIRYTLNGTEPTTSSLLYSGPIQIDSTKVLKAVTFPSSPGVLRSFTEFDTYFINVNHTFAVVSIAGDNLADLANGNSSLTPQGSIEYFDLNRVRKTKGYGEFNSHGQDSWANDQRSIDYIMRDELGYNYAVQEKLFPLSDRDEFQRVILRAAGDDNYPAAHHSANAGSAHIRDAYVHNLARAGNLDLDVRTAVKAIVYLNGIYWGVYDLREKPDDHDFTEYYYNQGKYDIQYIETWGSTWAEYGGNQALSDWNTLYTYIMSHDMSVPANYQYVTSQYDEKSLVDYVFVNSITVCSDWLNYNTGWWRGLNPDGTHRKWGYILWDNDATFGHYINYTGIPDTGPGADPCNPEGLGSGSDPEGHIQVLNQLRMNPDFEHYYISRFIDLMNTSFSCDVMLHTLDSIITLLTPEMNMHAQRWYGTFTEWQSNAQQLRDFISQRCSLLPAGMNSCYNLNGPYPVAFDALPWGAGSLKINSLVIQEFPWSGMYYGGIDLWLEALPDTLNGFYLDHWTAVNHPLLPSSTVINPVVSLGQSDTITAYFSQVMVNTPLPLTGDKALLNVYPSVFSGHTTVELNFPEITNATLQLYTLGGKKVFEFGEQHLHQVTGHYKIELNIPAGLISSGTYILRLASESGDLTQKLVYLEE
ncbi:MAG: CotH kinase family protein [Bacteroidia bacterium]|nr:CotH kinase family protein [Bacteroidia bacterium]